MIDVDSVSAPAFVLSDTLAPHDGHTHTHARHQLLYAQRGAMRLEVASARWLLPPQRAAWIGAGVPHSVAVLSETALQTVYFDADWADVALDCRVFAATPLVQNMVGWAARWGPDRAVDDPTADRFFRALVDCSAHWLSQSLPLALPRARTPQLQAAMDAVLADLVDTDAADCAAAAGLSPRTLLRRFKSETGGTFRSYLRTARVQRAMELLTGTDHSITDIAMAVGFSTPSAFSHAFKQVTGRTPRMVR